jgi:ABC-type nitrate/sulfonate/bicarbonate transport system permease component
MTETTTLPKMGQEEQKAPILQKEKLTVRRLLRNKWLIRAVTFVAIVVGWQIIGSSINPLFISTPVKIILAFPLTAQGTGYYNLPSAIETTLYQMLVGYFFASVAGVSIGLVMGMFRTIDVALDPYVNALYVLPRIALIPLIIIWFGPGSEGIIVVVFLSAIFPVIINTYAGIRNVSRSLIDTADVFEVKGALRFRRVVFPASLPFVMTGLRLGLASALIGVIVAELLLALQGMGYLVTAYADYYDTPQLMDTLIVLMLIGVALTLVIQYSERRISHWKETERAYR